MVTKTQVLLVDDVNGEDAAETVSFALDGSQYEIDLTAENAAGIREAFAPFVGAARKVRGRASSGRAPGRRGASSSGGHDPAVVRAWAAQNGVAVSDRGRISAAVLASYEAAN